MKTFTKWLENRSQEFNPSYFQMEKPISRDAAYPTSQKPPLRQPQNPHNPDGVFTRSSFYKKDNDDDLKDMHFFYQNAVKNLLDKKTFEFMGSLIEDIALRKREYVAYKPFVLDFINRLSNYFNKNHAAQMFLHYFKKYIPTLQTDAEVNQAINDLIS